MLYFVEKYLIQCSLFRECGKYTQHVHGMCMCVYVCVWTCRHGKKERLIPYKYRHIPVNKWTTD